MYVIYNAVGTVKKEKSDIVTFQSLTNIVSFSAQANFE